MFQNKSACWSKNNETIRTCIATDVANGTFLNDSCTPPPTTLPPPTFISISQASLNSQNQSNGGIIATSIVVSLILIFAIAISIFLFISWKKKIFFSNKN